MRFASLLVLAVSLGAAAEPPPRVNVARMKPQFRTFAASCPTDPTLCTLDYYGGHVIPNPKVYVVKWTASVSSSPDLADFYTKIANSPYLEWLYEDDTNIINTDTPPSPAGHSSDYAIGRTG